MAILFLFFSAQIGMVSVFEERRRDARADPRRPGRSADRRSSARLLGAFVMGVVAMATLVVATTLLIGADWGPPSGSR